MTALCFVIGFIIWNIYLYSLGFVEDDLLRARFIFTGFFFLAWSAVIAIIPARRYGGFTKLIVHIISHKISWAIYLLLWLIFYSLIIFPMWPLGWGGGQPRALSIIGDKEYLDRLNTFGIVMAEGAEFQTANICVAYESSEMVVVLLENRVLRLNQSDIGGLAALPGAKETYMEPRCINLAHSWALTGFISSILLLLRGLLGLIFLFYSAIILPITQFLGIGR